MNQHYTHLTQEERYQIYAYKKAGFSHQSIADELERHISTIKRELKRNQGLRGYRPQQANRLAQSRRANKPKAIKLSSSLEQTIRDKLMLDWSPEQIQGRLHLEGQTCVCPATIYAFIRRDKLNGGKLYKHLRHKKRYKQRTGSHELRGHIRNRVSIEQRPAVVEQKNRIGDWEADTVIGSSHQGVIVTLTERYSRLTLIAKTNTKKASIVSKAIIKLLKPYQEQLKTITYDNGKEFAYHEEVAKELNVNSYFTHPYSSWERGLNENHNGLIRQYLPKKEPFNDVSDEKIQWIEKRLNNRPKKVLHFQTPAEVYTAMCA